MAYKQENRLISIDTPLGRDVLLLAGFRGSEGISRLFSFDLAMVSENHNIAFESIMGRNVTISVFFHDGDKRYLNGIIARFSQGRGGGDKGGDPRFSHYKATMVPWPWLLTMTADSRIFQKMSVPDIVEKVFKEKGFTDYRLQLNSTYEKKDFSVQYRETDFNFIARLLENEGIYFFFEHENGKHTMVMGDNPQAHKPCPKQKRAKYQISGSALLEEDVITGLEKMEEIRPGKYSLNDFNFEIPNTGLEVNVPSKHKSGPGEREIYDYPGLYQKRMEGDRLAKIRMEEEETQLTGIHGSSKCKAFVSGYRFSLAGFYRDEMNEKDYLLTSVAHEADQGWDEDTSLAYTNAFACIPFDVPFRPKRVTPRPVVPGAQTAIVVGPSGEEIYTDRHGRVKVQFHWDREGKKDENSSCWIRVSQGWAGSNWGALYLPRIGQEVIVDFIEGDPDRPIVTGRVYHGTNKPPYPLPDDRTKSTIKSDSSPGGNGSNEIRFEDKKDKEEVYLHGQKDLMIVIEHDKNQRIGRNETSQIEGSRDITVKKTNTLKAGKAIIDADDEITLKTGMASLTMKSSGDITIKGAKIRISGTGVVIITGLKVAIN
jgi:type VI secretion system secreted protein VgrG